MMEAFAGAGAISGLGALAWWLRHDGPVRLYAGIMAVRANDATRRRDAREVLRCTGKQRPTTRPSATTKRVRR
ncbi:hypothetical protein [Nocardia brasiliensis]|uniref:hypothetical protein n=1 Tax=Nocardia brasiliensis TaxID=37326 RepID=UPI00189528C2|nr:hypothetical protein [Nocardia brasiliensis]MBF6548843.1 hypothetical protein [Nocardia brasiliensis]